MGFESNCMITQDEIKNILTMRYTPTLEKKLPAVTPDDFGSYTGNMTPDGVESVLKNSIGSFIQNQNPCGITTTLSSGIDSGLVLCLLRESFPELKITCISAGFDESDEEVRVAEKRAAENNCDFKPLILDNFLQNLPLQISIIGEPKWNYYTISVAQEAARHSSILISGDGGDELFGGYVFRYKKFLDNVSHDHAWKERAMLYIDCHERDWVDDQEAMFGPALKFDWNDIYNHFKHYFDNPLSPLEQVLVADYNGKLMYDWVPSFQKIHHHYNLLGFSPFLTGDVIRCSCSIPPEQKYDHVTGLGKLPLREILGNKKSQPVKGKRGFSPDLFAFWKRYGDEITGAYLSEPRIVRQKLINPDWISSAAVKAKDGDIRYINKLLSVLALEIWHRLFVAGDISPRDTLL